MFMLIVKITILKLVWKLTYFKKKQFEDFIFYFYKLHQSTKPTVWQNP